MIKISHKIAFSVVVGGMFVIASLLAIAYEKLDLGLYVIFFLLALYLLFFGIAAGRKFSSPVYKILNRADDLDKGDMKARVYLETKDEIGELAKIFNRMAEELERSKIRIEDVEKAVDIKIKARTESLQETVSALEQKVKNRTLELERALEELKNTKNIIKQKESEVVSFKKALDDLKTKIEKKGKKDIKESEVIE